MDLQLQVTEKELEEFPEESSDQKQLNSVDRQHIGEGSQALCTPSSSTAEAAATASSGIAKGCQHTQYKRLAKQPVASYREQQYK